MTIQQMEYIVAVNKTRHFVTAAEMCKITQPTLSTMIQRLEDELGIKIFDRNKHPIQPTELGKNIIRQAEIALSQINKIKEIIDDETKTTAGSLKLGIIPTLAPYIVPKFIKIFKSNYPDVRLGVHELTTAALINELKNGNIDLFIAATPLNEPDFLEIPLYYEKFVAYFSAASASRYDSLSADNMPNDNLWVLQEGHCLRNQIFNFCKNMTSYNTTYEAGNIDTLIRIVDENGGYSVIPELHIPFLTDTQKDNIREISSPPAVREVSIVIKNDFVKERLLNAVADTIKEIIPEHLLDQRLKKFSIRL